MRQLRVTAAQLASMQAHVNSCLPEEGCGLLAGLADVVQDVIPITNEAHSPVRFRMSPQEQVHAFEQIEAHGLDLLGIFHSHPAGPDQPSPTDMAEAAYAVVQLIWSRAGNSWKVSAFWIEQSRVSAVKLYAADAG